MPAKDLRARRRALEEQFFYAEKSLQLKRLRKEQETRETREALSQASGVTDDAVLSKLMKLGINADTMAALSLVPVIEVAWSDLEMQQKEKEAILRAAEGEGIADGDPVHELLEEWLKKKPGGQLLQAWIDYVQALDEQLTAEERACLKDQVMTRARHVAEAAGGLLGIAKISAAEKEMLAKLEAAFDL